MATQADTLDRLADAARRHFPSYVAATDPGYVWDKVHERLADTLHEVAAGPGGARVCIQMHPRIGKSRMCAVDFPAWVTGKYGRKVLTVTHSASLAEEHASGAKAKAEHPVHRLAFPRSDFVRRAAHKWTTRNGGMYWAAGVGTAISGRGADLLIVDDPYPGWIEAHSERYRQKVFDWFMANAMTRLSPTGSVLIIMTRWHPDDIVGRLTSDEWTRQLAEEGQGNPWRSLSYPALATAADDLGRAPGEACSPTRWPVERLMEIRANTPRSIWDAAYQQSPKAKGSGHVNVGDFDVVEKIPDDVRLAWFGDLATTEGKDSDYTALARLGVDSKGELWVDRIVRGQWAWPKAMERISEQLVAFPGELGVEAVALGVGLAQSLRKALPPNVVLRRTSPTKDKLSRALPWFGLAATGKFHVRRGAWLKDFISEVDQFPNGEHDDQVDAVSGGYDMLTGRIKLVLA